MEDALLVPDVGMVGKIDRDGTGNVRLRGECEHLYDTGGCHVIGVPHWPCQECWGGLHFVVEETEAWRS